jgi:hypothetical protein
MIDENANKQSTNQLKEKRDGYDVYELQNKELLGVNLSSKSLTNIYPLTQMIIKLISEHLYLKYLVLMLSPKILYSVFLIKVPYLNSILQTQQKDAE